MSRRTFACLVCKEPLGEVRSDGAGGSYLSITNALVIVWWDSAEQKHAVNCPCGEIAYWTGALTWRPIAA